MEEKLPPPDITKLILYRNADGYEENLRKVKAELEDDPHPAIKGEVSVG